MSYPHSRYHHHEAIAKEIAEARGGHHCPHKDGKKSHAVKESCVKKEHGGYCPGCERFVCFRSGCRKHSYKGAQWLEKKPETVKDDEEPEEEEFCEEKDVETGQKSKNGGKRSKRNS